MTFLDGVIAGIRRSFGVCCCHLLGGGRDATKHPTMHRVAPTTHNYLVPYVNSAESDKSCVRDP